MTDRPEIETDLELLESDLKRLEAEYNMYFGGRLARPPWETRGRVEALIKRWDRGHVDGSANRFRFSTLQSRFQACVKLWDRAMRTKEEGKGFFAGRQQEPAPGRAAGSRVLYVAAIRDPAKDAAKLRLLYDALVNARRVTGEERVPFHRFSALVTDQVTKLRRHGNEEVAFQVAIKDGKVNFTAKALRGNPTKPK